MNKQLGYSACAVLIGGTMIGMCLRMMQHDQGTNWGIFDLIGTGLGFLDILMGVVMYALYEEGKK